MNAWEDLDAHDTGFIKAESLTALLLAVPSPLGVKGQLSATIKIHRIVQSVAIPYR